MTPSSPVSNARTTTPERATSVLARPRVRALAFGGLAALVASGCAQDAPQDVFRPAGDNAQTIDTLHTPIFIAAGVVAAIVMAVVAYCVVKFRDRGQPIPAQTHGNPKIEITFVILPAIILVVIGAFTATTVFALNQTDDTECVVNVTGQQWWWEYDYPVDADGMICGDYQNSNGETVPIITSGQMVIPTDTNVLIRGTSRDVIHSFWVPRLNGKRDMVPGRVHTWRFHAWEPGIYSGQCAEFCGLSHANMRMEIVALDPPEFQAWLDNQLEPYSSPEADTLAATGEATFISQCARCHQVDGLTDSNGELVVSAPEEFVWSGAAPNLTNLMTRNTFAGATWDLLTEECRDEVWNAPPDEFGERYLEGVGAECLNEVELREWLRNSPAMKPMYADAERLEATEGKTRGMPYLALSEDQIDELVAYLLELK